MAKRMKGHRYGCHCVGCDPETRARGMRAMSRKTGRIKGLHQTRRGEYQLVDNPAPKRAKRSVSHMAKKKYSSHRRGQVSFGGGNLLTGAALGVGAGAIAQKATNTGPIGGAVAGGAAAWALKGNVLAGAALGAVTAWGVSMLSPNTGAGNAGSTSGPTAVTNGSVY